MNSWCDSKCEATGDLDEGVLDTSYRQFVLQVSDSIILDSTLQLKEPCSGIYNQDYVEKIKEFQFYADMVKTIVRPGCSPETLNFALSSMSSLVKSLHVISSKQRIHASQ